MIIVSTWKFLGFNFDLYRYNAGTIDRNVGHAALQVTSGPNKGVYVSWWPGGGWTPDEKQRYADPNTLKQDLKAEAENRRNQLSKEYTQFLAALEKISKGGGVDADRAKELWEAAMLGDTPDKERVKFRPPSEVYRIPSQADGELFGLDDMAIVLWWDATLDALRAAIKDKKYDESAYYDLMTNNCSDAIILALGAGLGRLDTKGYEKVGERVPRDYPEVPDLKHKIKLWKVALPIITPDTVESKAAEIMIAIGKMQTAYTNALKKIPPDKKVELLPQPKSEQFDKIDDNLLAAHLDKKAVALVTKALADYKDPKTNKAQDSVILAELLIDLAEYFPDTPGKDKNSTVNWDTVYIFANQVRDTIDQLLKDNAAEVKIEVAKHATKLWKG